MTYVPTDYEGPAAGVVYDHPPAAAGLELPVGMEHHTFDSASMGVRVGYNILVPPGYEAGEHRLKVLATTYPVVYYLHGRGDDENYQLQESEGSFCELLHSAMERGMVPEMIFVMAHAGKHAGYCDAMDGSVMGETMIINELLPHIEETYRTTGERALQGWSMGGQGALLLAFKYPSLFSSVIAMAAGLCTGQELVDELPQVFDVMHSSVAQYDENSAWSWVHEAQEVLRNPAHGVAPALQIICGDKDPQVRGLHSFSVIIESIIYHAHLFVPARCISLET